MFENFKEAIKIIHDLPRSIEGLRQDELQTLSDIKNELYTQKQEFEAYKKRIDDLEKILNRSDIESKLGDLSQLQSKISEKTNQIYSQQALNIDKINQQINSNIERTNALESLLKNDLLKENEIKFQNINNNVIKIIDQLDCQSESVNKINYLISEISNGIKNMDNAARLVLLASVISELDKAIEQDLEEFTHQLKNGVMYV